MYGYGKFGGQILAEVFYDEPNMPFTISPSELREKTEKS
jgi:hypothetical protein